MDPVTTTSAARDVPDVARAARLRTADSDAAATGGVAPKGASFSSVLEAAAEGKGTRGVGSRVTTAEAHSAVDGHRYAKITAGLREGSYVNTSGNARHGQAFALVERGGRTFHVYGDGPERRVVEIRSRARETTAGGSATMPAATTTPAATPVATTPVATAPVATTPATPSPVDPTTDPDPDTDAGTGGVEAPHEDA